MKKTSRHRIKDLPLPEEAKSPVCKPHHSPYWPVPGI